MFYQNPANGLIYDTSGDIYQGWNGVNWVKLAHKSRYDISKWIPVSCLDPSTAVAVKSLSPVEIMDACLKGEWYLLENRRG